MSIPVKEIAPQELSKDMTATQGSDHVWVITKSATPATVSFPDTCDTTAARSAGVSITVSWTKKPATPSGPITIITHVYATNPASRVITVNVSDDIRSGTTVLDTATSGPKDVPANTANFLMLTHQTTVASDTTNLNDVATATYTDKVTGIAVPGTTQATASATVQLSGPEKNTTATINDVESISGAGLSYSVDSYSGATGSFDGGYVKATKTTDPVSWTSDPQSGDGSVTFNKTVYVDQGTSTSGELDDKATLTGSDGFTTSDTASVSIAADARVSLTIYKTVSPDPATGAQTFQFHVYNSSNPPVDVANPIISFAAGDTGTKSVIVGNLAPDTYKVTEDAVTGWVPQPHQSKTITLPNCSHSVTFNNVQQGQAKVVKTVSGTTPPANSTLSFEFQLRQGASVSADGTILEDTFANAADNWTINFNTLLVPGTHYQLCEANLMPGWMTSLAPAFMPNSQNNPSVVNNVLCVDFTVTPGETRTFNVDNTPPPGGRALTIGFWKNWASCANSKGKQQPVLDQTLAKAEPTGIVVSATSGSYSAFGPTFYLVLHGSTTNANVAPSCSYAVNLLNKTRIDGTKKMASDPAFNLAAQLVAAELNYSAGAAQTATAAINQAVLLLGKYQFDGNTHTPISSADATTMNNLATTLDNYNNDR